MDYSIFTKSQNKALQLGKDLSVTAGAGSGKTLVLSHRYIRILEEMYKKDGKAAIPSILAITFTNKAAIEMQTRIRQLASDKITGANKAKEKRFWQSVINGLYSAPISTIHSLCSRILKEHSLNIGIDPDFTVLEEFSASLLFRESIFDMIKIISGSGQENENYKALKTLLRTWKKNELINNLTACERNRDSSLSLFELYLNSSDQKTLNSWKDLLKNYKNTISQTGVIDPELLESLNKLEVDDDLDKQAVHVLKALGTVFLFVGEIYRGKKERQGALDFNDLEINTFDLLDKKGNKQGNLVFQDYKYIMVDEFQDTNWLQWKIIDRLCSEKENFKTNLFFVGDPKQSIYGFRNADVSVFNSVKEQMLLKNTDSGVVFEENFRSLSSIINFINYLFPVLMKKGRFPFEVSYDPFTNARNIPDKGTVNFLIPPDSEISGKNKKGRIEIEAAMVAETINNIVFSGKLKVYDKSGNGREPKNIKFEDIGILLRTRNYLNTYEEKLKNAGIPYNISGGTGFFSKQEINDLINVIKFLANRKDGIALAGILRSPLFSFSDTLLFFISECSGNDFYSQLKNSRRELILKDSDIGRFKKTYSKISNWIHLTNRIPVHSLLYKIMDETGAWAAYSSGKQGKQIVKNIQKFIDIALSFERTGFATVNDFIEYIRIRSEESNEGEAAIIEPELNAVKIMTIHATKGLEFPVVFIPELNSTFSPVRENFFISNDTGIGVKIPESTGESIKETTLLKLIKLQELRKMNAEQQRLFYVACSRARDHLFLCFHNENMKKPPEYYLDNGSKSLSNYSWLNAVFPGLSEIRENSLIISPGKKNEEFTVNIIRDFDMDRFTGIEHEVFSGMAESSEMDKGYSIEAGEVFTRLDNQSGEFGTSDYTITSLQTFHECPYKYYVQNVLKVPEFLVTGSYVNNRETNSGSISLGVLAHEFFSEISLKNKTSPDGTVDKIFSMYPETGETEKKALSQKLLKYYDNFINSETVSNLQDSITEYNEFDFTARCKKHNIKGRFDKLIKGTDGNIKIIDFKTYGITSKEVETVSKSLSVQMDGYAYAAAKMFPDAGYPVTCSLYFTEPDCWYEKTYTREDINNIQKTMLHLIAFILNRDFFLHYDLINENYIYNKCRHCQIGLNDQCRYISSGDIAEIML